jgi:hypothetical protein
MTGFFVPAFVRAEEAHEIPVIAMSPVKSPIRARRIVVAICPNLR